MLQMSADTRVYDFLVYKWLVDLVFVVFCFFYHFPGKVENVMSYAKFGTIFRANESYFLFFHSFNGEILSLRNVRIFKFQDRQ